MNPFRIALANIRFPATPEESITLAEQAIDQAGIKRARVICFPECFVPGDRIGASANPFKFLAVHPNLLGLLTNLFIATSLDFILGKRCADEEKDAQANVAIIQGYAEVACGLENVFYALDLAAHQLFRVKGQKHREKIVDTFRIARVIAEVIGDEITLRGVVWDWSKTFRSVIFQVFV